MSGAFTRFGIIKSCITDQYGVGLRVVVPSDIEGRISGEPFVATDNTGSGPGDLVTWTHQGPSTRSLPAGILATCYPIRAAVVRIVSESWTPKEKLG